MSDRSARLKRPRVAVDHDRRITTICLKLSIIKSFERSRRGDGGRAAGESGSCSDGEVTANRRPRARPLGCGGSTAIRRLPGFANLPVPKAPEGEHAEPGPAVRVAGRIMLRRGQGKVVFLDLRDWTERIQIFIGKNQVGDLGWNLASCSTWAT